MPTIEKTKRSTNAGPEVSSVFEQVIASRPNSPTDENGLSILREQLSSLAVQMNLSVTELLSRAENSEQSTEEYRLAASLARRIAILTK